MLVISGKDFLQAYSREHSFWGSGGLGRSLTQHEALGTYQEP